MSVSIDPGGYEIDAIHHLVDFTGRDVIEVGCGDGRMTWHYAMSTASVLAVDPDQEQINKAIRETPEHLRSKVKFVAADINEVDISGDAFDVAILSYSL